MHPKSTDELLKVLQQVSTTSELSAYNAVTQQQTPAKPFHEYITDVMQEKKLTASQLIQSSQIPRTYGYQILSGTKNPGRDKVLSLCLALNMPLEDTQRALLLANEGALYPKNRRDAVIIFALNKKFSVMETNELLYQAEEAILK